MPIKTKTFRGSYHDQFFTVPLGCKKIDFFVHAGNAAGYHFQGAIRGGAWGGSGAVTGTLKVGKDVQEGNVLNIAVGPNTGFISSGARAPARTYGGVGFAGIIDQSNRSADVRTVKSAGLVGIFTGKQPLTFNANGQKRAICVAGAGANYSRWGSVQDGVTTAQAACGGHLTTGLGGWVAAGGTATGAGRNHSTCHTVWQPGSLTAGCAFHYVNTTRGTQPASPGGTGFFGGGSTYWYSTGYNRNNMACGGGGSSYLKPGITGTVIHGNRSNTRNGGNARRGRPHYLAGSITLVYDEPNIQKVYTKHGGKWSMHFNKLDGENIYVKSSGTWKPIKEMYVKVRGTWKRVWNSIGPA